ncbi:hypothetical protein RJ639_016085 [Escallonia herrerae]|uniref:Retrotransposon gag domain-containing protein n=1 Tax=Escallonia herrerae TaxID=1293975 RepID=A0AA88VE45_9ASTE|nr:hypothetical protein RJ639_016085 [Escallonia herrerae]
MPQCDLYDGTGDPGEHVYQFETNMLLLQVSDAVMCRAFPTTLRKATRAWFKSLQPRSILSFNQLSDLFQKHFVSSHSQRKNSASLLNVVQEKNESLACYLGRFNVATLEINNLDESVKYTAFLRSLRPTSKFAFSVNKSLLDLKDVKTPHDDPLVITIKAGNFKNKEALIIEDLEDEELVKLLRTYVDVFAWTTADMPGIDPEIITHRLNADPSKKPVKQKKRTFGPERQEKIKEEVD